MATIKVPILLQSGSEDAMKGFSDTETITKTADKIKAAGGDVTLHIYDGAGSPLSMALHQYLHCWS